MRGIFGATAAALLASAAGQARSAVVSQDFCHGLERVLEAARQEGGFLRLERSRAAPPHFGFRHGCRATGNEERQYWMCSQNLAPDELSGDTLAARVAGCLPEAVRGRDGFARDSLFTLPHAEIRVTERGGPRAKVGRIVTLTVEAIPAP